MNPEHRERWRACLGLSEAIGKVLTKRKRTTDEALNLQNMKDQRDFLLSGFRPRLVWSAR